ncbi:MAG: hypothetical protein AVDCRST_MAG21-8 [uncultured Nocardioidaceae bacterium]|uniref:Uncharacterized protein n=1 Tax=uncultured Nocardioidaceae bacterium TaxID=253824 RepID=A0A6J4MNC3_9ACTN|nr:MAG: hypothetical protein AVDCRST_MAG21-8 [uncultured Nocardioidaceae bacterium]
MGDASRSAQYGERRPSPTRRRGAAIEPAEPRPPVDLGLIRPDRDVSMAGIARNVVEQRASFPPPRPARQSSASHQPHLSQATRRRTWAEFRLPPASTSAV